MYPTEAPPYVGGPPRTPILQLEKPRSREMGSPAQPQPVEKVTGLGLGFNVPFVVKPSPEPSGWAPCHMLFWHCTFLHLSQL